MPTHNFLKFIKHLRQEEEIVLYGKLRKVSSEEEQEIITFLEEEYQGEKLNYPFEASEFNAKAAFWATYTIYIASQLVLYREHKEKELQKLIQGFKGEINASAMLSADLSLRFLPDIIQQMKMIDVEDILISLLEDILETWHFSGINYDLNNEKLNFDIITKNDCLLQLYCNRIIQYKKKDLLEIPELKEVVLANLGNYRNLFWKELNLT